MAFVLRRPTSVAFALVLGLQVGCGGDDDAGSRAPSPDENEEFSSDAGSNTGDTSWGDPDRGDGGDPSGPDTNDAGSTNDGGKTDGPEDLGVGDGQDVVLIGDSWMNLGLGVGIQQSVVKAANGKAYRTFGVPGTRLLDGVITNQYQAAKTENPDIKTLVMTGGGNDVLLDPIVLADCLMLGAACKARLDEIGAAYVKLVDTMASDGVRDLVIVLYTRGTLMGAKAIDYIWQEMTPICDSAPLRCHMVDSDELGLGVLKTRDGIHPKDEGYDAIGAGVVKLMEHEGMRR